VPATSGARFVLTLAEAPAHQGPAVGDVPLCRA
jgi:hypothetical protein